MSSIFFQAVGKPLQAILSSLIRDIICFIPLLLLLPFIHKNVESLLLAAPIADLIGIFVTIILTIYFMKSLKKEEKNMKEIEHKN